MADPILEIARNFARFAGDTETKQKNALVVRYFIGSVVSKSDGKITVKKDYYDTTNLTLPATGSGYAALSAGDSCFVIVPGTLSNAIVLGKADLSNL